MHFIFNTHKNFPQAKLVVEGKRGVLSIYSKKLANLGNKRWKLSYRGDTYYKNNDDLQTILNDSFPYKKPKIMFKSGGKTIKAIVRDMVYNSASNLKNNQEDKYYLVFHLDFESKLTKSKSAYELKDIKIKIKCLVLNAPRFKYGYCQDYRYRPCTINDYLEKTQFREDNLTSASYCRPFDYRKGPFNMYCAMTT